jgi:hypothetical protein
MTRFNLEGLSLNNKVRFMKLNNDQKTKGKFKFINIDTKKMERLLVTILLLNNLYKRKRINPRATVNNKPSGK